MTAATEPAALSATLLHDWHAARGAKMVGFAGWSMPVQYATGTIREHLATRRHAGLFDVSHMGRFRVAGAGAGDFLLETLTNDARALRPGEAHYTFIANEQGGAVDDAYLYRLDAARYLLIVNAANRAKDWAWLGERSAGHAVALEDVSETLGMISLQGPASTGLLEQVLAPAVLPENKRNRLSDVPFDGAELMVARTGYTGEAVCFELFVEAARLVDLWERLVGLGAVPCGLGARDSLRLEAGLPLYGHELGLDAEGHDIPIFANGLAMFAVRPSNACDYVGRAALERQRAERVRIHRGELDTPADERALKRLVMPIAAFAGRRPLRAGDAVHHNGEHVGYVTSGTSVPYARFAGGGISEAPSDAHELRPIGLALITSSLTYRTDRPIVLDVVDEKGRSIEVDLVEKNLWSSAPYARPYTGFVGPRRTRRIDAGDAADLGAALTTAAATNTRWRRSECVNLIASEQPTSAYVDRLSTADPAARYNEHSRLPALGPDSPEVRYYKGTAFIMDKEDELKSALRAFFGCARVEVRLLSGQMANDAVYDGLLQFKNRARRGQPPERLRRALAHDLIKGGHLSAQPMGALRNYLALDPVTGRPAVEHFPIQADNSLRIDVAATRELIARTRPELIVFGRSMIVHREPIAEVAEFVRAEFGPDQPDRPLIMYDAAHVLGLLGAPYQDPLKEGADIVTGSTHKTFFGPQRGVILSDIAPASPFEELWRFIESRTFPGHVSNHHLGTMLGLLGATYEMLHFQGEYPQRVIDNAKAFARALTDAGLTVEGDPACDYTETHQVTLRLGRARGEYAADLLEANNIIANGQALHDDPGFAAASGLRLGSQEMTRYGMAVADFAELAQLMAEILSQGDKAPRGHWRERVIAFRSRFTQMRYCFD